ncbi:LON peptidase substrate-binding domain-containing protein [Sphingomonas crusticola]|uniref:LON peptidase substrate-binding domain-containing protein n=1 Tax=Sphingomonas crusticola TaxID=1697973 RepID=UPI000E23C469|nr:LON peptidase substrate-binding domain-containing protein [Sphingomonas crusticola]
MLKTGTRLSIFPLSGALLLPGAYLPLHIFEPRYRALVSDALARDRQIAMIQPLPGESEEHPALFDVGCVGKIGHVEALPDGRFNLILEGQSRFRLLRELDVTTPFRQIQADLESFGEDAGDELVLASAARAGIEQEARRFAEAKGYNIDWDQVARLDDQSLVNGLAQVIPFDVAAKQALLEAANLEVRADLLAELLRFSAAGDGDGITLQ